MRILLVTALTCVAACSGNGAADAGTPDAATGFPTDAGPVGVGPDPAVVAQCSACHAEVGTLWTQVSSHSLLLDCTTCHSVTSPAGGAGHADRPTCERCHSEVTHAGAGACLTCHQPHGSSNTWLVRETVVGPDGAMHSIHLSRPEGATLDGLVRAGVDGGTPGTGLCEVCHTTTGHYRHDGQGTAHHTAWCGTCHDHQQGLASP